MYLQTVRLITRYTINNLSLIINILEEQTMKNQQAAKYQRLDFFLRPLNKISKNLASIKEIDKYQSRIKDY